MQVDLPYNNISLRKRIFKDALSNAFEMIIEYKPNNAFSRIESTLSYSEVIKMCSQKNKGSYWTIFLRPSWNKYIGPYYEFAVNTTDDPRGTHYVWIKVRKKLGDLLLEKYEL